MWWTDAAIDRASQGEATFQQMIVDAKLPRDYTGDHHVVYVVRLDGHPGGDGPAFYVGMTGLSREERFLNHLRGHKGSRVVARYGVALVPPPPRFRQAMSYDDARAAEPALAAWLKSKGSVVYSG